MTDTQWIATFIVSLLVKLIFNPLPRTPENKPVIIASSLMLIVSGIILLGYTLSPQKYEEPVVEQKVIVIYRGTEKDTQVKNVVKVKQAEYYLWGLVKDSVTEWETR